MNTGNENACMIRGFRLHITRGRALFDEIMRLEYMMETNPYQYNTTVAWIPQQNQHYESSYVTARTAQQRSPVPQNRGMAQRGVGQKPRAAEKMPKARAQALVQSLKKWLAVASLVGFGTIGGLVAFLQVGTTSSASQSSSGSSNSKSTTKSSSQNSNNFLNQGGGNLGSSSSSSTSVSGSSVS